MFLRVKTDFCEQNLLGEIGCLKHTTLAEHLFKTRTVWGALDVLSHLIFSDTL